MPKKQKVANWGNYPIIKAVIEEPLFIEDMVSIVKNNNNILARGNGRCYGDAALNDVIISTRKLNKILDFDIQKGIITCQAGILLSEILHFAIPRGFFIEVTPGTKYITLGGAIAADVHGKNHHKVGCFSNSVFYFDVLTASGEIIKCDREKNTNLFYNTIGGMGLTGIILTAKIQLLPIQTVYIRQESIKTKTINDTITLFEKSKDWTYTVAWIDCLKKGKCEGRSIFLRGEHAKLTDISKSLKKHPLKVKKQKKRNVPFFLPSFFMNQTSIRLFNFLYYHKQQKKKKINIIDYNTFFYPLDQILNWNKLYGKKGFTQYQFVIPKEYGIIGIKEVFAIFRKYRQSSFLTVFKEFGAENLKTPKSFPMTGYTVALDIKINKRIQPLINELDHIILKYKGRNYLAKDAYSKKELFNKAYLKQNMTSFNSHQYQRLTKKTS